MIGYQFALYLGKEKEEIIFSYLIKENFVGILKMEGEFEREEGKNFLEFIFNKLNQKNNSFLDRLEEIMNLAIKEFNLPANFSAAIGVLSDQVLYLKTTNTGAIYVKRDNKIGKIIDGDNNASGYIQKDDYFIFSFKEFYEKIDEKNLLKTIAKKTPYEIVEELNSFLKNNDDSGLIALMVKFFEQEDLTTKTAPFSILKNRYQLIKSFFNNFNPKRKIAFFTVFIVVVFLLINISQALLKSFSNSQLKKITQIKGLVISKLNEAEESAFFNIKKSKELIDEAKDELNNLQKELNGKYPKKTEEIKKLISEKEAFIFKKEEKQAKEFYDLTIEAKDVKGDRFYLSGEDLFIFDKKNGRVFRLDLIKKSIETVVDPKLKKAELISAYEDKKFFFIPKEGIYQIEGEKIKKVIEADQDWGKIVDFWIYNANLYLLDKDKDEVYKYLVVSDGFSSKKSYFQPGEAVDLADSNSMAIDGAIYLGFSDYILKYLSGVRESFKVSFPSSKVSLTKIYTNKDLEKVFALDKKNRAVYVFSKKGEYEREIKSPLIGNSQDFVVFGQKIYLLLGNKIYTIDL